ncbi:MAG: pilus assembly protein PilM [Microbacteriaceae bacterium]|nr:pilus assembly protein PilM [Microbacteriaceae bacterium]
MAKNIVGVDISANGIRAVELSDVTKARPTIVRHHEVPLPAGAVNRGEVVEPRTVTTAIKQLWSAGGFKTKDVVLGIGNSRVLVRDLTVPKMSLRRIRESLPFHVQEMLPFPTEDALLDFYPISEGTSESGPIVNGLLVAAVKGAVLGNVNAVQLAGLNPVEVDLVPFALSRALLRGESASGTTTVIDVGGTTTTLVVSANGVPQFVRIIPTGGDDLTNALSTRLNISVEEAEAMKRSIGMSLSEADPEKHDAAAVMFEVTRELITSLRNTLTYFAGARSVDVVGRIVLTGGGSQLSGFGEALSEFTRLPVSAGTPFDTFGLARRLDREALQRQSRSLTVALGLAMGRAA